MTQPDLSIPPQFTAAYWEAAPRKRVPTTIMEVNRKDGLVQIVFVNNMAITRRAEEIRQLIFAGTSAEVEMIGEGLVTGMFLPDVKAWAFRMTAQHLAEYAREYTAQQQAKQEAAQENMRRFLADTLIEFFHSTETEKWPGIHELPTNHYVPLGLADHIIAALNAGPPQQGVQR